MQSLLNFIYLLFLINISFICCEKISESISKKKCEEYNKSVFEKTSNINITISTCVVDNSYLINPGYHISPGNFPHSALIGYPKDNKTGWYCNGVLISDEFVLITASCVKNKVFGSPVQVRVGAIDINTYNPTIHDIKISQIFSHPEYNETKYYNDIALLKLEQSVDINKYVRPICLSSDDVVPNQRYLLSGLQRTDLGIIYYRTRTLAHYYCEKKVKRAGFGIKIDDTLQFCSYSDRDICKMISGSALQTYEKDNCMYSLYGLLSFGKQDCKDRYPTIFTKIKPYINWIESIVWP